MNFDLILKVAEAAAALLPKFPGEDLALQAAKAALGLVDKYRHTPGGSVLEFSQGELRQVLNEHFEASQAALKKAGETP